MTNETIKVRDLAAQLELMPKDIIAVAKELDIIAAKVATSNLSEQEASRIRTHFSDKEDKRDDVIVRRRRTSQKDANPAPEGETVEAIKETPKTLAKEAGEELAPKEVKEVAPAKEKTAPAKTVAEGTSARVIAPPKQEEKSQTARIITPPPARRVEETSAKKIETPEKTAPRVESSASFSAEPEKDATGETISSAPAAVALVEENAEATEGVTNQVRVISRPSAKQIEADKKANAIKKDEVRRPARTPRPASPGSPAPAQQPAGGAPAAATDGEGRARRRPKGRRTVEFDTRRRDEEAAWNKATRRKGRKHVEAPKGGTQPQKAVKRKIRVEEFIRVSDLAHQMGLKAGEIIKNLFGLGVMATINQSLDVETASLVAMEFGYEIEKVGFFEEEFIDSIHVEENEADKVSRPPVVTIMGHVDHGKTSLLDALRKSSVVTGEAGGITQHIGAYHVKTGKSELVFLDTPGHEAFTAMRARGAEVTDIVVLVVAADDGVMEQTREAVNHAKAANVPIMVAINKIDKEAADPERVKRALSELGLISEDWGGDTVFANVSAKTREGLDELLDLITLQSELLELKANPNRPATGRIVEAKLDKGRGSLGTVLIQQGTLRLGDCFVCGTHAGRVRSMVNDQGKKVKEATPSMPVEVQGFEGVPEAGEEFVCVPDEKTARKIAEARAIKQRDRVLAQESKITLETFLASSADDFEAAVLKLVVKSDVQGSLEAVVDAVNKLTTDKVRAQVIHGGAGAISESDILLATASNAIVIGFNVRPSVKAKELAEHEKIEIRYYDVIYKLVEDIENAMEGMLAPIEREVSVGSAEVKETFSVPKLGVIAGSQVVDGKMVRNAKVRLLRDGVVVYTGKVISLRRFKDDVREVQKGYECGIGLENYNDIKAGDVIEAFEIIEEAAKL